MAVTVKIKNKTTGELRTVPVGFSWTSFFIGFLISVFFFVPLFRGDGQYFAIFFFSWVFAIVVGIFAPPVGVVLFIIFWLVACFKYNKFYIRKLAERGFVPFDEGDKALILAKAQIPFE